MNFGHEEETKLSRNIYYSDFSYKQSIENFNKSLVSFLHRITTSLIFIVTEKEKGLAAVERKMHGSQVTCWWLLEQRRTLSEFKTLSWVWSNYFENYFDGNFFVKKNRCISFFWTFLRITTTEMKPFDIQMHCDITRKENSSKCGMFALIRRSWRQLFANLNRNITQISQWEITPISRNEFQTFGSHGTLSSFLLLCGAEVALRLFCCSVIG